MEDLINLIEQHTLLIVFFNVLLSRGGLPLPVLPTLLTAAALAAGRADQIGEIILAGISGTFIADLALFWCGLRYGQRFLALLCRVSFSPDFCVRRTTAVYARMGWWSLPFAKFIPGLSLIAVAMAGVTKVRVLSFLLLDGLGALLFVSANVALGVIFQDAITSVLSTLAAFGMLGNLAVVAALALYLLIKWWRRQLFIRQLRMNRITVAELRKLIDDGEEEILILDVRPKDVRAQDGIIPGAIAAHPDEIDPIVKDYSRDLEIIVYCACPNEESAATAAKHLKQAGFKKIRPLLGGIDAWVDAGHPIERAPLGEKEVQGLAGARQETVDYVTTRIGFHQEPVHTGLPEDPSAGE
jgi:membrane protein DedA with SNARE-associated domain/rhodanese-related sulfurtransferase